MSPEKETPGEWVNRVIDESHQEVQLQVADTSFQALINYDIKQAARHKRLYQVLNDLEQAASPAILPYLPEGDDIKGQDRLKFLYYKLGLELHQYKPRGEEGSKQDQDMMVVQAFHDKLTAAAGAYGITFEPLSGPQPRPKAKPQANDLWT